jgi:hypothetical protein
VYGQNHHRNIEPVRECGLGTWMVREQRIGIQRVGESGNATVSV